MVRVDVGILTSQGTAGGNDVSPTRTKTDKCIITFCIRVFGGLLELSTKTLSPIVCLR